MSKINEKNGFYPIVIMFLIGLAVFAVLFLQKSMEPIVPNVSKIRTEIKVSPDAVGHDSIEYAQIAQRLDTMQTDLANIRDQYQMDINIGIDRLNSWIGFWLGIATLVFMLAGIWQYLQVRRHDEAWEKMEEKFCGINNQFEQEKEQLKKYKEGFQLENSIFNVLRTMSAFHDPLMLCEAKERKNLMLFYLEKSRDLLSDYHQLKENKFEPYSDRERMILVLIYSNFRLNLCRSLDIFTSPSANFATKNFLDYVEPKETNFRYGMTMYYDDVDEFLKELDRLIVKLKKAS